MEPPFAEGVPFPAFSFPFPPTTSVPCPFSRQACFRLDHKTMAIKEPQPPQVNEDLDPLASLTAPPKNETKTERFRREQQELSAKHISDRIDEDLNGEKVKAANRSPAKKQVRVLVLGHRASGKSFHSP